MLDTPKTSQPNSNSKQTDYDTLDDRDFHAALTTVAPHLRAFARTLCGCREGADDLAQETLLKAWSARASYRAGTNFKAWTFAILRNHFYSEARRRRFIGEYNEELAERTLYTEGNQEGALDLADVLRALETLPDTHREALILVAVGDMPYDEIAAICGVALGTVKSRICRARAMLASVIENGQLPDSRHNFVMEGDAIELMFAELRRVANNNAERRQAVA
ncbi:MAG: sigma-70 family RNA polymerase sigma factor [Sphingomonadales bacterium]|nr:sigma-70 family RNA polymerase sigma factor [Sphingomonadales bacterium]